MISQIRCGIGEGKIPAEALVDFIDSLRENANQHVFLYRLTPEHKGYLEALRAPEFMAALAGGKHADACRAQPPVLWEADEPALAAAVCREQPRRALLFKWVETRRWHEMAQQGTNEAGLPVFIKEPRSERSVSFFRIHLDNGDCEMRIERMHPNATKTLREAFGMFVARLGELIEYGYFERVLLEPVISRLMIKQVAEVQDWTIELSGGGDLRGNSSPTLLQRFGLLWRSFAGVELNAYWPIAGKKTRVHIVLDGRKDYLTLYKHAAPSDLDGVIARVRALGAASIESEELRGLVKKGMKAGSALRKLDRHFSRLGKAALDSRLLLDDEWLGQSEVEALARDLATHGSDSFKVAWHVVCPVTRQLVCGPDGPLSFADYSAIPDTVACLHPLPLGSVPHPTRGNLRASISMQDGKAKVSLTRDGMARVINRHVGLSGWLRRHLGKAVGAGFVRWAVECIKWTVLLLVCAAYAGFVWKVTGAFLELAKTYDRHEAAVLLSYLIVLLASVGLLILIFGWKTVRRALKVIKEGIGLVGEQIKSLEGG
ncbi:MAG: hypothetical protein C0502_07185 [Opitutus sp.]|nr:hypothetical protein [Opitutus sp.]